MQTESTLVIDKTENGSYHYGFAVWNGSPYHVTISGGSTAKFNATKLGDQTDNQCFAGSGTLNVYSDGTTFEMNAVRYFGGTFGGTFHKGANITVNGVAFDMTKPISEIRFGEMGMKDCSITNKPSSADKFYVGEEYKGEGLTVNAVFGLPNSSGGLSVELESGFEIEPVTLVNGWNTVKVKVGDKTDSFEIFATYKNLETVHVSTVDAFNEKLADNSVGTIILDQELTFDTLNITRNITVQGNIKVTTLTVSENIIFYTRGRVWSQDNGNLTISGKGTLNAKEYFSDSDQRVEHAAIHSGGMLNITEATVICSNLSTEGTVTIEDGAKVTVYGKRVVFATDSINGLHINNGDLIVRGTDTELNVLFNDRESLHPAALQANTITVDGATLNVGSSEAYPDESWTFAIWFNGNNSSITATNGAHVTFNVTQPMSGYSIISGGDAYIYVRGESTFTVITPFGGFDNSKVQEGNVMVLTPEQAA